MKSDIKAIKEKIDNNETLTEAEKHEYILYSITDNHTGKMENMVSISTSCLTNPYCIERRTNENLICNQCYAAAQLEYQNTTNRKMEYNTVFYTRYMLNPCDIPLINATVFRAEAFGDVQNVLQCKNYYTIARKNPHCTFVAWTKNPELYANAGTKPKNFMIVYSMPGINMECTPARFDLLKRYNPIIDKVFCVFTEEYANENNVNICCGNKHCCNCLICYKKNTRKIINELVKKGSRKKGAKING